jgi:two-component system phosphate regulon sensor histidine kinase PhoR
MIFFKRNKQVRLIEELNASIAHLNEAIHRLENENIQMQAILNSMVEGVITVDKDTRVTSINPTVTNIFNISKEEVVGRLFLEGFRNNDISEVINSVFKKGEFISRELNLVWPLQKTFQVNASPLFEKNTVSGCLVVIHDITEMKRLETMRRDFVANVSHELKTPLTSINGFVETLLEGAIDDKENSRHFLKIIQEHAERLNSLINDLLELSAIESKVIQLQAETFRLKDLADEVLFGFKVPLRKKAIEVKNELEANLSIKADKSRIEQVLANLLDNAIKFNKDKGYIRIYAQDSPDKVKIIIEDSGIGIPRKDIPRLFERFYRVDKARSRQLGGTGLGLSIVKHIVELHRGSVGVESQEGFGSNFWFALPK